ncbi:hypothetical protein EXS57_03775 [Candidatus Kaiserbacteria bacterium]|nr:hypothetical protein [Candidatus Kaiserbacteria bacterium]
MRGGYRAGAGRKRGFAAKLAEEARTIFAERVAQEIGPLSDVLISKAKAGDIRALHELLDRAWGRAPQGIEMTMVEEDPDTEESNERVRVLADALKELQYVGISESGNGIVEAAKEFRKWYEERRMLTQA